MIDFTKEIDISLGIEARLGGWGSEKVIDNILPLVEQPMSNFLKEIWINLQEPKLCNNTFSCGDFVNHMMCGFGRDFKNEKATWVTNLIENLYFYIEFLKIKAWRKNLENKIFYLIFREMLVIL